MGRGAGAGAAACRGALPMGTTLIPCRGPPWRPPLTSDAPRPLGQLSAPSPLPLGLLCPPWAGDASAALGAGSSMVGFQRVSVHQGEEYAGQSSESLMTLHSGDKGPPERLPPRAAGPPGNYPRPCGNVWLEAKPRCYYVWATSERLSGRSSWKCRPLPRAAGEKPLAPPPPLMWLLRLVRLLPFITSFWRTPIVTVAWARPVHPVVTTQGTMLCTRGRRE